MLQLVSLQAPWVEKPCRADLAGIKQHVFVAETRHRVYLVGFRQRLEKPKVEC